MARSRKNSVTLIKKLAESRVYSSGWLMQIRDVGLQSRCTSGCHTPLEASEDGWLLILGEIDPAVGACLRKERRQDVIGRREHMGACQEVMQQRSDPRQIQAHVYARRRQGGRHGGITGRVRVLDDHRSACGFYRLRSGSAIGASSGENHGDQPLAIGVSGAREQQVNGWLGEAR